MRPDLPKTFASNKRQTMLRSFSQTCQIHSVYGSCCHHCSRHVGSTGVDESLSRRHDTNIPVKWTMEWTKEQVIILIELYEAHPALWDPTDPSYKNKVKKIDAWKSISAALAIERAEVEKKMKTLIGQFHREVKKSKSTSGSGAADVYESNWFAYSSMTLLLNRNKPHGMQDVGMQVSTDIIKYIVPSI